MIFIDYVVTNIPVMDIAIVVGRIAGVLILARGETRDEAMAQFSTKLDEWSGFTGKEYGIGKEIPPTIVEPDVMLHRER